MKIQAAGPRGLEWPVPRACEVLITPTETEDMQLGSGFISNCREALVRAQDRNGPMLKSVQTQPFFFFFFNAFSCLLNRF